MSGRLEQRWLAKTASFTVRPGLDAAGTRFSNRGATGTVIATLPAPSSHLKGWWAEFELEADYTFRVAANAAGQIVTVGNAAADSVGYELASNKVGRRILAKCDGTSWMCLGLGDGFCVNGVQVEPTIAELTALIGGGLSLAELQFLDGVVAGTAAASKALVLDANKDVGTIHHMLYSEKVAHASELKQTKSANFNAAIGDCGYVTEIDTDGVVVTLPATAAGLNFTFRNIGADAAVGFSLSPNASDKISGAGLTPQDNKDLINTKATAKKGDLVQLIADGVDGWVVVRMHGTWAREA